MELKGEWSGECAARPLDGSRKGAHPREGDAGEIRGFIPDDSRGCAAWWRIRKVAPPHRGGANRWEGPAQGHAPRTGCARPAAPPRPPPPPCTPPREPRDPPRDLPLRRPPAQHHTQQLTTPVFHGFLFQFSICFHFL